MSGSTPTVSRLTKSAKRLINRTRNETFFRKQGTPLSSSQSPKSHKNIPRRLLFASPTECVSKLYRERLSPKVNYQNVIPEGLKQKENSCRTRNAVMQKVIASPRTVFKPNSSILRKLAKSPSAINCNLDIPILVSCDTYLNTFIDNVDVIADSPHLGYELDSPFLIKICKSCHPKDLKILGRGSFGCVYFMLQRGERRAVKVTEKNSLKGDGNTLGLKHPNVASVLQLWNPPGCGRSPKVAIMEYGGASNLHRVLLDKEVKLSSDAKNSICTQIVKALLYCHSRCIVHLDIKPANVLISSTTGICKLADFGCSIRLGWTSRWKQEVQSQLQSAKRCNVIGTVAYVAPELFQGHCPSISADIYSLGILLHQVETRKIPFEGFHPHTIIYRVVSLQERPPLPSTSESSHYWKTVVQCWKSDPLSRPSAAEILYKISHVL